MKPDWRLISKNKLYILITCLLLSGVLAGLFSCLSQDDTREKQEEFAAFALEQFKEMALVTPSGNQDIEYDCQDDFSYAVRRESSDSEAVEEFINREIEKRISLMDKEANSIALVDVVTREAKNGVFSILFTVNEYGSIDEAEDIILLDQKADSYLLNQDGKLLDSMQYLKPDYVSEAARCAEEFFSSSYMSSQLREDWQDYISPEWKNYNCFLVNGDNIVFFFDRGKLLNEEEGIVKLNLGLYFSKNNTRTKTVDRFVDPNRPMVAVTYDDGPGRESELSILETLSDNGAVATFFYLGYRMEYGREAAEKAAEIGCEIGNHSWDHPQLSRLTDKEIASQISKTSSKIESVCGVRPVVARPPYGDFNNQVLEEGNIAQVLWTVDTLDWKTRNPELIFKKVKNAGDLDGKVILMHSIYNETAKATELIIPWLKEEGYQTVTVSELIEYKTGKKPEPGTLYRKLH